jgi:hypothetical protein
MYPALSPGALLKDNFSKLPEPFKSYWAKAQAGHFQQV